MEREVLVGSSKMMMLRTTISAAVLAAGIGLSLAQSNVAVNRPQDQPKTSPQQPKEEPKGQTVKLMGCVDEQNGKWVLVNDQTMAVMAMLAADGFPTEAFAKYLGHKVNVRGTGSSGGSSSTFKVREIETISETCAAR